MEKRKKFLTNDGKKIIKRLWRVLTKNMFISFEAGASIAGFIMVQFVWIYILKFFIGTFVLWFIEITNYSLMSVYELTRVFWVIYGIWFFICILSRLSKIKYYREEANIKPSQ